MKRFYQASSKVMFASLLLSAVCIQGPAVAEEAKQEANPLQFYTGSNGSFLKATFQAELALFDQNNSWFGKAKENLGEDSGYWWESTLRPGLEGSFFFAGEQSLYGMIDAVQANTGGGYDAGGSNVGLGDVSDLRVQNAFVGWRSGTLFSSLDKDFLDISFGRQQYKVGNGFLIYSEGGAGGERGAFWIGGRRTADYAGIVRIKSNGWTGDLVYLENDPISDLKTKLGGATIDYTSEQFGTLGGGIYTIESDIESRDSMVIYNARGGVTPFAAAGAEALKPIKIEAEYVYEDRDNGWDAGNGWYVAASYPFEEMPWKPAITYRYASFDENYDTLFYGFSDWGSWFQGEILGEYALGNANLDSHMLKLKLQPIEPVTVNLMYFHFTLHDAAAFEVTSEDYADEFNLVIDWAVNDHLSLSLVGAVAEPDDAAKEHTGGDETWTYGMLYGTVKF